MFRQDDSKSASKLEYKASFENFRKLALEFLLEGERYMEGDSFLQDLADDLTTDTSAKRTIRVTLGHVLKTHAQAKDLADEGVMSASDLMRCLQRRAEHEFRDAVLRSCYQTILAIQKNPQLASMLEELANRNILSSVEQLDLFLKHHRHLAPVFDIFNALRKNRDVLSASTFGSWDRLNKGYRDACVKAFDQAVSILESSDHAQAVELLAGALARPGRNSPVLTLASRPLYDKNVFRLMFSAAFSHPISKASCSLDQLPRTIQASSL